MPICCSDIPFACTDLAQLVARIDVDLVSITTPPATHKAALAQALDAGKHVLLEKPLAVTVADALEAAKLLGEGATAIDARLPTAPLAVLDLELR